MQENPTAVTSTLTTKNLTPDSEPELGIDSWQMLQIYSIYRFLLASAFFILIAVNAGTVGKHHPLLYLYILLVYFLLSIVYAFNAFLKNQAYYSQVMLQIITDIVSLAFILFTSGGLSSGLNILFLPVIAAASVLTPGKNSFFYAAIATIAVLTEQTYSYFIDVIKDKSNFTLAGLTGIAIFATAIAVNYIYRRLTVSQQLGQKYKETIVRFEQIISTVLHKMPLGVIVVDAENKITIINYSAQKLLAISGSSSATFVTATPLPSIIANILQQWRDKSTNMHNHNYIFELNAHKISAQFIPLGEDQASNTIIILDDVRQQEQQAQNIKLISLGRLTASIAHEIRNPLNAISHSTQLLSESKHLQAEDARLLHIIQNNSDRTNKIIESVLLLSKSKPIAQQQLHLKTWINKFINQFVVHGHQQTNIEFKDAASDCNVFIDPVHLQQILTNLCENGIRYSMQQMHEPYVLLALGTINDQIYLDVIDRGHGIETENLKYLFEPFFTTESSGTGLGLYVAHELCQANGARLEYIQQDAQGGCFRIYFPSSKH